MNTLSTKAELYDGFDEMEGRERLYHSELESIIGVLGAIKMLDHELPNLKRVAQMNKGTWGKLMSGFSLLKNGAVEYTTKIAIRQYYTLKNNNVVVSVTQAEHPPKFGMTAKDYYRLIIAARCGACGDCLYCMNRCDWQKCEMRKVFDSVPTADGLHEKQQYNDGLCPYALLDKLEFSEEKVKDE